MQETISLPGKTLSGQTLLPWDSEYGFQNYLPVDHDDVRKIGDFLCKRSWASFPLRNHCCIPTDGGYQLFLNQICQKNEKESVQTIALSVVYMIIGFSCWMVIPIRANANPPMNLNDPDTAIGMLDYYNREQYGDWPTIYGQNYTAFLDATELKRMKTEALKQKRPVKSTKKMKKPELTEKPETDSTMFSISLR
jgi:hypothetical protein